MQIWPVSKSFALQTVIFVKIHYFFVQKTRWTMPSFSPPFFLCSTVVRVNDHRRFWSRPCCWPQPRFPASHNRSGESLRSFASWHEWPWTQHGNVERCEWQRYLIFDPPCLNDSEDASIQQEGHIRFMKPNLRPRTKVFVHFPIEITPLFDKVIGKIIRVYKSTLKELSYATKLVTVA